MDLPILGTMTKISENPMTDKQIEDFKGTI